ncbi:MAG: hypothetical protein LC637_03515 [Xanthomonadaceae bacterium]|nr:hypothetical protein [Xanthomonadaceae bacterium]
MQPSEIRLSRLAAPKIYATLGFYHQPATTIRAFDVSKYVYHNHDAFVFAVAGVALWVYAFNTNSTLQPDIEHSSSAPDSEHAEGIVSPGEDKPSTNSAGQQTRSEIGSLEIADAQDNPARGQTKKLTASNQSKVEALQHRRDARRVDRLPSEEKLLLGENLDIANSERILSASPEDFDQLFDHLQEQGFEDPLAYELTELYSDYLARSLGPEGSTPGSTELACGLRACIARSSATGDVGGPALDAWQNDPDAPPIYALIEMPFVLPDGAIEHRLLFTTDPGSNAITIPAFQ